MDINNATTVPRGLTIALIVLLVLTIVFLQYGEYASGAPLWALITNAFILAIPTGMLYFSIWVLVLAARQRRSQGTISGRPAAFIYWTPRIAAILITLFVTLFSLDVFEGDASIWEKLGGFVIHSIPSIILAIAITLTWRRDWLGFGMFTLAAIAFLLLTSRGFQYNPLQSLGTMLIFSAPMALIAAMFWVNWKWRSPAA